MVSNVLVPKLVSGRTDVGMPGSHLKKGGGGNIRYRKIGKGVEF